ncbi:MAG: 3-phosphoshikimate 1-carboxyvinyltransferase [Acholeplasmatales bacterium]|nr:3-phosphoshikimate 1-carboxyvinyltransferase [Acholeplasmatales bacterium]
MDVRIRPHKLSGEVIVPPSKSLAHRAIICASLAQGTSVISNVSYSKDILATISAMESLGAIIDRNGDTLTITGSNPIFKNTHTIDANESGSTLRFLIPIALVFNDNATFVGHNRLVKRPLDVYFDIFDKLNINYSHNSYLPLTVNNSLKSGDYIITNNSSSQFITGLLFALPMLNGDSRIILTEKLESIGYINLTLDLLQKFGIKIIFKDNMFIVPGSQTYKPFNYKVEGDYSQAAFFFVAQALGNDIKVSGLTDKSLQGDKEIVNDLIKAGCNFKYDNGSYTLISKELRPVELDMSQTPDLGPILSVLFTQINGKSSLVNAERLRIKECDRITDVLTELKKCNVNCSETKDSLTIQGISNINGATLDSHNDHRLVMSFAIMSTVSNEDIIIKNAGAVSKSFPNFFDVFKALKGDIEIYE